MLFCTLMYEPMIRPHNTDIYFDPYERESLDHAHEFRRRTKSVVHGTTGLFTVAKATMFGYVVGIPPTRRLRNGADTPGSQSDDYHYGVAFSHGIGLFVLSAAVYALWGKKKVDKLADFISNKMLGTESLSPVAEEQKRLPVHVPGFLNFGCE